VGTTRRELLEAAWRVGGALLGVAGAWTTFEALRPLAGSRGGGLIGLEAPDAYEEGSATYVREGRLYVTRVKGELFAVTQKCPHLGCRVPFCESSGQFECPCHGSYYNLAGEWISGPAPRGMDRYPLQIVEGRVVVDTSTLEQGAPLGSAEYATPARGGSCAIPGTEA
jgi:nitrite reductase/ring-hydroxylating ferredoxin subunit